MDFQTCFRHPILLQDIDSRKVQLDKAEIHSLDNVLDSDWTDSCIYPRGACPSFLPSHCSSGILNSASQPDLFVCILSNIMDPLTALSLACNALQIIDFGATMIAKCKELYKHGALAEYQELESMARHLTNLSTDMKLPEPFLSAESVQQEDMNILTLAQQCSETANELICELRKLGIRGTHRKRDAVRKAIKETWNQNPIESIQRRLEQYQRTLNTLILINLRYVRFPSTFLVCTKGKQRITKDHCRQHARKVSTEQSKAFKDLDRKVQTFINAVAGDQEPFAALKELIQNENASCKHHVMLEAEKVRSFGFPHC